MSDMAIQRVRLLYEGEAGRRWRRIDEERPASYFERNIVLGRRQLHDRLLEWLADAGERRILDAGCGLGRFACRLAATGTDVTAVDLLPGSIEVARRSARAPGPRFVVGDFVETLHAGDAAGAPFDTVVLTEVLEDYRPAERFELLRRIASSGVRSLLLGFRTAEDDGGWLWERLRGDDSPGIDPIELLRWIHLATPLRQQRQSRILVRNYRLQLSDLRREG